MAAHQIYFLKIDRSLLNPHDTAEWVTPLGKATAFGTESVTPDFIAPFSEDNVQKRRALSSRPPEKKLKSTTAAVRWAARASMARRSARWQPCSPKKSRTCRHYPSNLSATTNTENGSSIWTVAWKWRPRTCTSAQMRELERQVSKRTDLRL
jgi:hypothetical protein